MKIETKRDRFNLAYHGEAPADALEKDEFVRKQVGVDLCLEFLTQLKYRRFRMYSEHSQPKRASQFTSTFFHMFPICVLLILVGQFSGGVATGEGGISVYIPPPQISLP